MLAAEIQISQCLRFGKNLLVFYISSYKFYPSRIQGILIQSRNLFGFPVVQASYFSTLAYFSKT